MQEPQPFQLISRSLERVPVGVPFEERLPKLDRPNRLSTLRDVLRADILLLEALLDPVLRGNLGYLNVFLHHLGNWQSMAGFCWDTPRWAPLPTAPASAARDFDVLLNKTLLKHVLREILGDWAVDDLLGTSSLDSVMRHHLRYFSQLLHHWRHGNNENLTRALQDLVLA